MRKVKRPTIVILYNLIVMLLFFIIYYLIRHHFSNNVGSSKDAKLIDIINLSVTIQTSVGVSNLVPITDVAKIFLVLQQILLIFGNLIILHFMI